MRRLSLMLPVLGVLFVFKSTDSPHESSLRYSCKDCHSSESWKFDSANASFSHDSTAFVLTGRHKELTCRMCHPNLVFFEANPACHSCHTDMHAQRLGNDCSRCHSCSNWLVTNTTTIHQQSRFPLVGAHAVADCQECHGSVSRLRFDIAGVECLDCHLADYQGTTQPNHQASGIHTSCDDCHKVNAFEWGTSGFSHSFFPLTLGHSDKECNQCHKTSGFSNISPTCSACHQPDYEGSLNPNHVQAGFSTNCTECHTTVPGWSPVNFNHDDFALTLGHAGVSCEKCHVAGNYTNTSSTCSDCHMSDYSSTTNPSHVSSGFSTNCNTCHTVVPGWSPASFDHTLFPLSLGHAGVACTQCHLAGNYTNTSPVCSSCHMADYSTATNPSHTGSSFPTTCSDCHTTAPGWSPSTFNHDGLYFPIYSGNHGGQWSLCTECHSNPSDYSVFTCLSCHEHNQASMTSEHDEVSNFQYNSNACLSCHPNGNSD